MIDLIEYHHKTKEPTIKCLDHGHVKLIDMTPRIVEDGEVPTAEHRILNAARQSYESNKGKDHTPLEDRGLIRYLMRHNHTTPTEMIEFTFHHRLPVFVARQLIRHRTASVNEMSGRYSVLPNTFYNISPSDVRKQSKNNKQGSDGLIEESQAEVFSSWLHEQGDGSYDKYLSFCEQGISKEIARSGLPVNIYTEWYWKIDLKNLLHFLNLRCDSHAQYEIRVYADAMLELIKPLVPWTIEAWEDYSHYRGGLLLTKQEAERIAVMMTKYNEVFCQYKSEMVPDDDILFKDMPKREQEEFKPKLAKLGLGI